MGWVFRAFLAAEAAHREAVQAGELEFMGRAVLKMTVADKVKNSKGPVIESLFDAVRAIDKWAAKWHGKVQDAVRRFVESGALKTQGIILMAWSVCRS